jgi:hypothetical protein
LPYHNWRRPLPCPIALPDVPLTLSTLEDVRALVPRHLPAEYRAKDTGAAGSVDQYGRGAQPVAGG